MANSKISALTAATTPLAGTEVLAVVQSGVTKQVSVANLTAGRAVSMSTLAVGVASPATTGEVSGAPAIFRVSGTGGTVPQLQLSSGGVVNWSLRTNQNGASDFTIYQDSTERFLFASGGDLTFKTGNLIQGTAAKGINFNANTGAAGVTSKLLNWYEEGTWTPADNSGAGLTFTNLSGNCYYTRNGNLVTCIFNITFPTTANGSTVAITGLPFIAKNSTNSVAGGYLTYSGSTTVMTILVGTNSSQFFFYQFGGSNVINSDFSGKTIRGVITYMV